MNVNRLIRETAPETLGPDFSLRGERISRDRDATLFGKIAENFNTQAEQTAIMCGGNAVTYSELARRTFLIRDALKSVGIQQGQLIGIVTRGQSPMIAAMLGIWASGCAFAPLAGDGPKAKREEALGQLGSNVVLVDSPLDKIDGYYCVVLSEVLANSGEPKDMTPAEFNPQSAAYGFFTSGSTGSPKCCINPHSGLNNRGEAMSRVFDLKPGQAVLQNSSHVFDSSLWQIFWPLSFGGTVVISERESILDFRGTLADIQTHQVVMTDFVPTILEQLLKVAQRDMDLREKMASMRFLLVGGEAVTSRLIKDFTKAFPHIQLVNTYGPTEASIGMVFHHFTGEETKVPLGQPIDNTGLVVVDENMKPVPWGTSGEIVIGGACMGLGYLGNPKKTAEAFVVDKELNLGSEIVYRTGDIGHIGADGLLYFDGRADDQIKINGVRIEFGEIEHHLNGIEHVQWCKVAKVVTDGRGWLAGFFTADQNVCTDLLKLELSNLLDPASIPSLLVQVDDFPKTVSGKVDTKALVRKYCIVDNSKSDKPCGDNEAELLAACRALLPGREVTVSSDFFALGLDSLGSVTLALTVEGILGKAFTTQDLMAAPNVAEICKGKWETGGITVTDIALDIDGLSDLKVAPANNSKKSGILLTGATGYVGQNILLHLLRTTEHDIICPIRGKGHQQAFLRLMSGLPIVESSLVHRIKPVLADFGTDDVSFASFGNPVSIVHVAAEVNFTKGYRQLRKANVEAVAQLCAFAHASNSHLIHVSSAAVLANGNILPDPTTNLLPAQNETTAIPSTGYGQTKWAAEHIVQAYRRHGLSADILRLGEVMPDRISPIANPRSSLTILCRASAMVGCLPDMNEVTDYTPITVVMELISKLAIQRDASSQTLNLINPHAVPIADLLEAVLPRLPVVPLSEFQRALFDAPQDLGHDDIARAKMLFGDKESADKSPQFQCPSLLAHLRSIDRSAIEWPTITSTELGKMLAKLRSDLEEIVPTEFAVQVKRQESL